jgi:son of sevenless-like protein
LNNFSTVAAITAGLNGAPITRLRRTRDCLNAKTLAMKAELDYTMDSSKNFQNYKDRLKSANPPCVPFFGTCSYSMYVMK